ncbi:MAG TPA: hypothetical protein VJP02_26365 [Candidatus Sulfotelmatobacter sp.]|nr:hypothetical protein [Candidatus Sulfotelmatobacter sp.]
MKKHSVVVLGAAIVLPLLAQAKLAFPNEAFGRIEGAIDACSQIDSKSAEKYQELKKYVSQGATDEEVGAARATREYKAGYVASSDELSKKPPAEALKTCAASLETKK